MTRLYRITHTTSYEYTEPVSLCQNLAHLTPRDTRTQHCRDTGLLITPEAAVLNTRTDYFGNLATFFTVQEPHRELTVTARHIVEVANLELPEPEETMPWEEVQGLLQSDHSAEALDAAQYCFNSRYVWEGTDWAAYARDSFTPNRPLLAAAIDLTARIHRDFQYDPSATTVATSLGEIFEKRRGVCQDFAHLEIACLRSLGLAARYVSGYLNTERPAGSAPLVGADATHAWLSIFCPGAGWIDLDPTNNQIPGDQYILLGWGRDYDDVSPLKGIVLGGGQHSVHVAVDVVPQGG